MVVRDREAWLAEGRGGYHSAAGCAGALSDPDVAIYYVTASGFIRMPGVNPLPHGSSDSPQ